MRSSRYVTGAGLVVGALAITVTSLVYPTIKGFQATSAASASAQTVSTQWGPLTANDRDLMVRVRLAGLWEFPAGQMALQKGTTAAVKTAGQHLVDGHTQLDAMDRTLSAQLGITLPNQPTVQQQGFLSTFSAATGADFDQKFANIVRLQHGKIFPVIALVRATTRNTLVRQMADMANNVVLDHITVLEGTGLVNFDQNAVSQTASSTLDPSQTNPPSPSPGDPEVVVGSGSAANSASPTFSLPPAASSPAP